MTEAENQDGGCICGAVRFTVADAETEVGICHCATCRRWSGGILFAIDCGDRVTFSGEENIATFRSSDWAERGFCKVCGASLFYRLIETCGLHMAAGAFDDQSPLILRRQIFIDEKPGYYDIANETEIMTGAETFAMFAPPDSD